MLRNYAKDLAQMALRNYARGPHRFASGSPALSELPNSASPVAPIQHFSPAALHLHQNFLRLRRAKFFFASGAVLKRTIYCGTTGCRLAPVG